MLDIGEPTEETLNHLLVGLEATQFVRYEDNALHIFFDSRCILTCTATMDGRLKVDILGPSEEETNV